MKINLFYNYYTTGLEDRDEELDYCFNELLINENIDKLFVHVAEDELETMMDVVGEYTAKVVLIVSNDRPTFKGSMYDVLNDNSGPDDINISINSDCYFGDDTDWSFVKNIKDNEVLILSRYNIKSIEPFELYNDGRCPRKDSQDCWVYKGVLKEGLDCDFKYGIPGCDNRIVHEFIANGFTVSGPVSKVKIFHYHISNHRTYNASVDKVKAPYRMVPLS